jgi:hypothetical protein
MAASHEIEFAPTPRPAPTGQKKRDPSLNSERTRHSFITLFCNALHAITFNSLDRAKHTLFRNTNL